VATAVTLHRVWSSANGRFTEPEEVANVIVLLCSQADHNVVGETIRADRHFLAIDA
jgi:NAD(P)-dependent dehydrogenase (short-subunit alcohol dehydrogenase family)